MAVVTLEIPDEVMARLTDGGREPGATLCQEAAFSLCRRGELSTSQAARLAGLTYTDFLELAARAKVELFPVDLDEFMEEVRRGYTLGRQRVAGHPAGPGETR